MCLFLLAYEDGVGFDSRPTGAKCFLEGRDQPGLIQQEGQGLK